MFALSVAQFAGYILPLILLPYTAAILGPNTFGVIGITQAVLLHCTTATNYGFGYSATRQITLAREDRSRLSIIVVSVWCAKAVIVAFCLIASLIGFLAIPPARPYMGAYLCAFATLFGTILYPDFFFQGVEQMKWITVITVIPKVLLLPLIFVVVNVPSDYWKLLLVQSGTSVVIGLFGAVLVRKWLARKLPAPRWRDVILQLREGRSTFLSCAAMNFNPSFNTLLLGAISGTTAVGYYTAGQKVVNAIQIMWSPVSQALYPYFCSSFRLDAKSAARGFRATLYLIGATTLLGSLIMCALAPRLVPLYLGPQYVNAVPVIQVLIFVVCATSVNNFLGVHGLLAMGLQRDFLRVMSGSIVVNIALTAMAIRLGGYVGLAAGVVALETCLAMYEAAVLRRRRVL